MSKKRSQELDFQAREQDRVGSNKRKFHTKDLTTIQPKTPSQEDVFYHWNTQDHLMLHGSAGCGKSFLALYLALREVLDEGTPQKQVVIIRSAQPTKSVGFIPGTLDDKQEVYESPYKSICDELFPYSKTYENLKKNDYLDFLTTSYLRGCSIHDSVIIVDECASATFHELDTVMTRVGEKSRIIFCGDTKQSDLQGKDGLGKFMSVAKELDGFGFVNFTPRDVVRSGIVKSYLIKKEEMGL